ncbi:hypothetical protein [Plantactinospora sp. WMMB782]|uniref:hypothetical protein n=1 Tax=Plantactinospora sp. WMMB782 TaxID=3404121 RepID=UPI003B95A0BB
MATVSVDELIAALQEVRKESGGDCIVAVVKDSTDEAVPLDDRGAIAGYDPDGEALEEWYRDLGPAVLLGIND